MLDIKIEDSLNQETLMTIDTSTKGDHFMISLFYTLFLLFNIALCFSLPPKTTIEKVFAKDPKTIKFELKKINYMVDLISFHAILYCKTGKLKSLIYSANFYHQRNSTVKTIKNKIRYTNSYLFPKEKKIFSCINDYFSRITVEIDSNENINYIQGIWQYGNYQFIYLKRWQQVLYGMSLILIGFLFVNKLKFSRFLIWHNEQKITLFLIIFSILMDNPLSFIFHHFSPKFNFYYEAITSIFYKVYIQIFLLILFELVRYRYRNPTKFSIFSKIIFGIVIMFIYIYYFLIDEYKSNFLFNIFNLVYFLILCYTFVKTLTKIEISEVYKFLAYGVAVILSIIISFIVNILKHFFGDSTDDLIQFCIKNLFTITMTIFHWPYEILDSEFLSNELGQNDFEFLMDDSDN